MPKEDTARRTMRRKKDTTLREAVMGRVEEVFGLQGLDAAIKEFDELKVRFSGCEDWHDIEKDVKDFFMEKRREEQLAAAERQQQIDQALVIGLAKGISGGQVNLLTGTNSQAPYYSSTPTIGGHKP